MKKFEVGDLVLIRTSHLGMDFGPKLGDRYVGKEAEVASVYNHPIVPKYQVAKLDIDGGKIAWLCEMLERVNREDIDKDKLAELLRFDTE